MSRDLAEVLPFQLKNIINDKDRSQPKVRDSLKDTRLYTDTLFQTAHFEYLMGYMVDYGVAVFHWGMVII